MTKHLPVMTLALALAMTAPLAANAQNDDAFTRGVAAYEDGDYARAARLWAPLAEDGEAEAQRNLAQLYRLGLGVEKDDTRAYDLYVEAAEQNSVDAQVNVAFLLLTGEGVEKDSKQAALWFAKAADQGDALAQFNLGLMYEKGVGVPQDRDIARELYQLSANQGQSRALARLDAIEEDLPPDGGATARREREEAAEREAAAAEAEARERERQKADVERARTRAKAEAEEKAKAEKSAKVEQAEVEARTGPILMFERIEKDEDTEEAAAESDAVTATKNAESSFSRSTRPAPEVTPPARRKPQTTQTPETGMTMEMAAPSATMPAPSQPQSRPRPGATMEPVYEPSAMPRGAESPSVRQVRAAMAAYERGNFTDSARMLMPLARDGMPIAQFLLGRMFNRGEGVELDHFEAYNLWRSAAANGSEQAATALANFSTRFAPSELAKAEQNYQALQRWLAQGNR